MTVACPPWRLFVLAVCLAARVGPGPSWLGPAPAVAQTSGIVANPPPSPPAATGAQSAGAGAALSEGPEPLDAEALEPTDSEQSEALPPAPASDEPGWTDDSGSASDDPGWHDGSEVPPALAEGSVGWADTAPTLPGSAELEPEAPMVEVHGFAEAAVASRTTESRAVPADLVLAEARGRIELSHARPGAFAMLKVDLVADRVVNALRPELREAHARVQPVPFLELSGGQRVLTWGTGDFVFVNDLFPKDFVSFFSGRADEFLKAPVTHLKLSLFSALANLDLVYMPVFTPDAIPSGERLAFYMPALGDGAVGGQRVGAGVLPAPETPELRLRNGELAGRLYGSLGSLEWAAYAYLGRTKQPLAFDAAGMRPAYARLGVYGLSLRGPVLGGIANAEGALYDARDNRSGADPLTPPPQLRAVFGYEHELVSQWTMALQYYGEARLRSADGPRPESARAGYVDRHWLSLRLTVRLLQEDLTLSAFAIAAPFAEPEGHVRLSLHYRLSDGIVATLGANLMAGPSDTFFGQFADSTNAYARLRYSF